MKKESPNTPICSRVFDFNSSQDKEYSESDNKYTIALIGRDIVKNTIISENEKIPFHIYLYGDGIHKVENFVPKYSIDPNLSVAKSAITIGASYNNRPFVTNYSSWGSTEDKKIMKPDFSVPSGFKTEAIPSFSGTSASVPYMTGLISLMMEKDSNLKKNPNLVKLTLKKYILFKEMGYN